VQYEYLCASATLRHDRRKGREGALCRSRTAGQGNARNETARKQNTSASAFQAKGDLRLECRYLRGLVSDGASSSALHRMDGKVISQLPGFRIFAASLPLPSARATPEYRDPDLCRWASSLRASICRRLLPSTLPLEPSASVVGNRGISTLLFAVPFRSSVSRKLCACRAKQKRRAFPHPLVGILNDSPVV
jgi:hypothetical protein